GRPGAGPGRLDPRGTGRPPPQDPRPPHLPLGRAALLRQDRHPRLSADLPLPARRPGQAGPGQAGDRRAQKKAEAGEIVLLSQDEARFPMVPTLGPTLGVKGHRPMAATRDCKDLLYVFAVVNLVSAAIHSNTLESPKDAKKQTGQSKTRRLQEAFAGHL